jgi:hypothetical protein
MRSKYLAKSTALPKGNFIFGAGAFDEAFAM